MRPKTESSAATAAQRGRPAAGIANRRRRSLSGQFLRYLLCAGSAALVNFAAGSLLVDGLGFTSAGGFPVAVAAAYACGMAVNFLLNRRFTFTSDRVGAAQMRTFVVVALSGLALTTALAALLRPLLGVALNGSGLALPLSLGSPETVSRATAIAAAAVYSFLGHKYLTFSRGIRAPVFGLLRRLRLGGVLGYN